MKINVIYNEDCLITMNERIERKSVDVILTSPPYNMTKRKGGITDSGRYDVYKDWMTEREYVDFSIKLFKGFDTIVKQNGVVLYNMSFSKENGVLPYLVMSEVYNNTNWTIVDTIVWEKNSGMPVPADMRHCSRKCELVFVLARKTETSTFNRYPGISSIGSNGQTYYHTYNNIVRANNNDGKTHKLNQATYSTSLCKQLLSLYAKENDIIYDTFMGTGTTGNACVQLNMNYIGSELSKNQCEFAKERILKNY